MDEPAHETDVCPFCLRFEGRTAAAEGGTRYCPECGADWESLAPLDGLDEDRIALPSGVADATLPVGMAAVVVSDVDPTLPVGLPPLVLPVPRQPLSEPPPRVLPPSRPPMGLAPVATPRVALSPEPPRTLPPPVATAAPPPPAWGVLAAVVAMLAGGVGVGVLYARYSEGARDSKDVGAIAEGHGDAPMNPSTMELASIRTQVAVASKPAAVEKVPAVVQSRDITPPSPSAPSPAPPAVAQAPTAATPAPTAATPAPTAATPAPTAVGQAPPAVAQTASAAFAPAAGTASAAALPAGAATSTAALPAGAAASAPHATEAPRPTPPAAAGPAPALVREAVDRAIAGLPTGTRAEVDVRLERGVAFLDGKVNTNEAAQALAAAAGAVKGVQAVDTRGLRLEGRRHLVVAGDNLFELAERYYADGGRWKLIWRANDKPDPNNIEIGRVLVIPPIPAPNQAIVTPGSR